MADTKTNAEETPKREGTPAMPAKAPAPRPAGVAAPERARPRIGTEPKRLSKGQRKHLRRQKEAREAKGTTDRRQ